MQKWKGQSRGSLLGYAIFIFILKRLGLGFAYFILIFVAFYFFIFSSKSPSYFFFRKIQEYSIISSVCSIYLNYFTFGQVLLDKIGILMGADIKYSFNFENEQFIRDMDEGGILLSAHVGNWEIAGQLLNRIDKKFNILMFDAEHQKIKNFLDKNYSNKNFKVIVVKDDLSHVFEINRALLNKELVCMHADRFINKDDAIKCDFLGSTAYFPRGPFYLAARYNVPVSFVYAMKESFKHYHFSATEPKLYFGVRENLDDFIAKAIKDYIHWLENVVKKYPLQWFNYYKFWEDESI